MITRQTGSGIWFVINYGTEMLIASGLSTSNAFKYGIMATCLGFVSVNIAFFSSCGDSRSRDQSDAEVLSRSYGAIQVEVQYAWIVENVMSLGYFINPQDLGWASGSFQLYNHGTVHRLHCRSRHFLEGRMFRGEALHAAGEALVRPSMIGMVVLLALAIHATGIEIYLYLTPCEAARVRDIWRCREVGSEGVEGEYRWGSDYGQEARMNDTRESGDRNLCDKEERLKL
ncbi:uncharacterized protein BDR25DRAFT_317679 [Lindgomyces ingoldianus]|uniref:Uncharacterized protein n=1 Tax=Lindgomyces ingoldianus TaxID=673940 RepID=A0ACB6QH14_9PLEO|nr:uncharacterized protein BDR25DRAFT_317679 [Lindgomyces ingoldianus]KAF2466273.1 hypothetical protein BDR25DRAFT_317679 [Lindgomyces ingoldianus]